MLITVEISLKKLNYDKKNNMGTEKHDVIVIGGGHNGLIVAAYLVKANVDVCVLESLDKVGGGVITRDLPLPGFKYDVASLVHASIQANPLIHRDELGLKARFFSNVRETLLGKYIKRNPKTPVKDQIRFVDEWRLGISR